MALGILSKKITNAFKLHKKANGDMAKLKNDLVNDGWKITQDSNPVTPKVVSAPTPVTPRMVSAPTPITPRMVSAPSTVDVIVPKKKYASIGTSQMRSGRSSTIQTSSVGLLSQATIKKKTLLGA